MEEQLNQANGIGSGEVETSGTPVTADGGEVTETKSELAPGEVAAPEKDFTPGGTAMDGAPPRTLEEINKEYSDLVSMAGEAYFQREFHDANLKQMGWRHRQLVQEGTKRTEINKKLGTEAKTKAEDKRARKEARRAEAMKAGMTEVEADVLVQGEETPTEASAQ